jgi:hypothetical protein
MPFVGLHFHSRFLGSRFLGHGDVGRGLRGDEQEKASQARATDKSHNPNDANRKSFT